MTKRLTMTQAVLPIITMVVLFVGGTLVLDSSPELLVVVLLGSATVAALVARRQGKSFDDLQRATSEKVAAVLPVVLILFSIGMLIGTWVLSGTIPFLVYWGVTLVQPQYLLVTAFLATVVMSSFTGTSWGSAGTVGVALMGTAAAIDAPLAATAGAVVSGAYFGDKMSPLSDSTIIAAMGANAPLYSHIRHMVYTSGPSFVVALIVYTAFAWFGSTAGGDLPDSARVLLADLQRVFRLHWIVLLPPAVAVWSIVRRVPPVLGITLSSFVAAIVGVTLQPFAVQEAVSAAVSGFRPEMAAAAGVDPETLGADFRRLVGRGGLYSMATTMVVIISAFLLAAGMEISGAIDLLITRLLAAARSVFRLIAATMAAGATMIALTSHGGVTSLVIGGMFQQAYRERGLAPENLSRSIEDSVTITEPLMPWTVSAIFMATTLGVPTVAYLPWAVFCYCGPMFSLLIAATYARTGFGIRRLGTSATAPVPAVTVADRVAAE
jgi:NhaC family Na+:H+ antiporter